MHLIRSKHEISGVGYSDLDLDDIPRFLINRERMELRDAIKDSLLPFLPAKSLIKFMSVSKEWNQWIKTPLLAFQQSSHFKKISGFFAQKQDRDPTFITLDPSSYGVPIPSLQFLPEPVDILSSCNGLLACHGYGTDESFYICNPANKEWTPLPPPLLYHGAGAGTILAFEPSARNIEQRYSLICAVPVLGFGGGCELCFELYNSSSSLWRVLNTTLVGMEEDFSIIGAGFYMKGVAYWLTNAAMVIAFDVESELHEVIPIDTLPCLQSSDGVLTQIGGELCYIGLCHLSAERYDIMIHGGVELRLQRRVEISIREPGEGSCQFRVLPGFDGEIVMILVGDWIYSYRISDGILEGTIRVGNESVSADNYLPYVNSLVGVVKVQCV